MVLLKSFYSQQQLQQQLQQLQQLQQQQQQQHQQWSLIQSCTVTL